MKGVLGSLLQLGIDSFTLVGSIFILRQRLSPCNNGDSATSGFNLNQVAYGDAGAALDRGRNSDGKHVKH